MADDRKKPSLPEPVRSALRELKAALAELYAERLRGLYLYGSYARGTADDDSDIDVLIALEGEPSPFREIDLLSDLLSEICLRNNVLIAIYPVSERCLEERHDPLFESIRREGVLL